VGADLAKRLSSGIAAKLVRSSRRVILSAVFSLADESRLALRARAGAGPNAAVASRPRNISAAPRFIFRRRTAPAFYDEHGGRSRLFLFAMPVFAIFLQLNTWDLVERAGPIAKVVMVILLIFSLLSWAVIFSKWASFRNAQGANRRFLRAFRKASGLEAVAVASEQFRASPLVAVFDFGYSEVDRQMKSRGGVKNKTTLERSLQLGISEEVARLERNMNILATTAAVSPFIGLFGTVMGIIDAFQELSTAGAASLRAVAPGISEALITTALGLAAAIPAAVAYNWFGSTIREFGARMDDFALEFLNMTERNED